ncbi:type IV secretory system conjugative DNA transfer family protein [Limnothrix sp. FACHB-708]|uniref:type IV secretory system conjugative DNA transfer family protein n=1 Tax=unclassified Limnothrix TaxID=2632864 RepID=UPI0016859524|nr:MULTISPECIES: type IV secretory system conjugative DNA transfer family protein [unclassified Limnothrix]MBD2552004.1 type IV secretory system conjugative DNA transfer family protein [Limnothrix sp. FACHB-708]MBD2589684.1 type IV secretory system conjugative DNA transfer family protein [Limnothrix sp. FACHB-406]
MTWQDSLENLRWGLRSLVGGGETIIGPLDSLPPTDIDVHELRDYSGTATLNEITNILRNPGSNFHNARILKNHDRLATQPVFNVGKFLDISRGRTRSGENIWLQENSIYKNLAIIGPPGSGKTGGFIIPGIKSAIDAGLSNIVIDVKGGELIDKLGRYAESRGVQVIYWSALPQEVSRSHSINLLDNISSIQDAQILAKALYGNTDDLGENRQFATRDITWIAQWIILIKQVMGNSATLRHVYEIAQDPLNKLSLLLQRCQDSELHRSIQAQLRLLENSENADQAFTWVIQDSLSFFSWPNFEQVTNHSDILLRDIQNRQTLFVIGAELAGRDISKKISVALIDILMTIFYERWTNSAGGLGIAFWLDEFPRIQKQIDIAEFSSVARSAKGGIIIASQSLELIDPDYRDQVMENFDTVILCRNVGDGTANWLVNRIGDRPRSIRRRRHHETNPQDEFPWFRTRSSRERYETSRELVPILEAREIKYPVGDPFVATVHSKTACRKPFLVDYTEQLESSMRSSMTWNPSSRGRLNWRDSNQMRLTPSSRLIWREGNQANSPGEQADARSRLNWRD